VLWTAHQAIPAAFADVNTLQSAQGLHGGNGPFSLCVIHKEGLCLSSGDINTMMMMMMMMMYVFKYLYESPRIGKVSFKNCNGISLKYRR
jgi:hypothetical protein